MVAFDYPLRFERVEQAKLWGVERWLVSTHPSSPSVIANGSLKGMKLPDVVGALPVLIKDIHAEEWLSIQVHPGEKTCKITGGEPKSEMWRVLSPGPLLAGFKPGPTRADVDKSIADGGLENDLCFFDAVEGDIFDIPAGLVHALGAGIRVFEVQQSSDTTFRFYDWNRKDENGCSRQLHIEKSLAAVDWDLPPAKSVKASQISNFRISDDPVDGECSIETAEDLVVVFCAGGELSVAGEFLAAGDVVLLPPGFEAKVKAKTAQMITVRIASMACG